MVPGQAVVPNHESDHLLQTEEWSVYDKKQLMHIRMVEAFVAIVAIKSVGSCTEQEGTNASVLSKTIWE